MSKQHLSWRQFFISGISQLLVGRFLGPSLTDSKLTFIYEIYVPATFVHISIISGVNDPIWKKILGPNLFLVLIFMDQHFFEKKMLSTQIFFGPKNFCTEYFSLF